MPWGTEPTGYVSIWVGGQEIQKPANEVSPQYITDLAREKAIRNFMVSINGNDIQSPEQFPTIHNGDKIEISPFDKWGT